MIENLLNPIGLSDSVNNVVKNITDKPTKNIGDTLSDLWFLVLGGVSQSAQKRRLKYAYDLTLYESELNEAINRIPDENQIEPSMQLTAQALENSKYCISETELRHLFVNLISSSMDSSREPYTHPSFAEIIKQMSPIDAQILKEIPTSEPFPLVDYISENTQTHAYRIELENVFFIRLTKCDIFQSSSAISSLTRLGLIALDKNAVYNKEYVYKIFLQTDFYKKFSKLTPCIHPLEEANIIKYCANLTPLGKNFVRTCVNF